MSWLSMVGFLLAIVPVTVTPGASFTLVTSRSLVGDRAGALATIAGTAVGIVTHALLAAAGLALLVMQSAQAYTVIRLIGAAYLVGLGLAMVFRAGNTVPPGTDAGEPEPARRRGPRHAAKAAATAYTANVLNVKAAAVYLTLAPQFVPAAQMSVPAMLALAGIHVLVMTIWLVGWAEGLRVLRGRLDPRNWLAPIRRLGGVVLILLGIRTAIAHP